MDIDSPIPPRTAEHSLDRTRARATSLKRSHVASHSKTDDLATTEQAIKRARVHCLPDPLRNLKNSNSVPASDVPIPGRALASDATAAETVFSTSSTENTGVLHDQLNVVASRLSPTVLDLATSSAPVDGRKTTVKTSGFSEVSPSLAGESRACTALNEENATAVRDEGFDTLLADSLDGNRTSQSQACRSQSGGSRTREPKCAKCQDELELCKRLEQQVEMLQAQLANEDRDYSKKAQVVPELMGKNLELERKLRRSEREKHGAIIKRDETIGTLRKQLGSTEATRNALLEQCQILNREIEAFVPQGYGPYCALLYRRR
ncbi:hypothetical protein EVJ58_g9362 [Rhodofomes roseus]|uniref:Uncharacterized protein n=1 Tax=Rhodofomes roseus TaxID=34475 RepID=A0A4Y9XW06_9APHY|nr:hypothetical protein EVJ58_g9362 [Rhodofomes roseus]